MSAPWWHRLLATVPASASAGWEVARLWSGRGRRRVTDFFNELFLSNLVSTAESVLQEDEFRHVAMPPLDPHTAPRVRELRLSVHQAVAGERASIGGATQPEQRRVYTAAAAAGFAVLVDAVLLASAVAWGSAWVATRLSGAAPQSAADAGRLLADALADAWSTVEVPDRWWLFLGGVSIVVTAVWATRHSYRIMLERWQAGQIALADQVRPLVRVAINEFVNTRHPTRLLVENAPGLAEAHEPDQTVARPQFDRVRTLADRLGASTIAISGPRGIGKTTLLRAVGDSPPEPGYGALMLRRLGWADPSRPGAGRRRGLDRAGQRDGSGPPRYLVTHLVVPAPVTYHPRDFLLHLYLRLCELVLEQAGVRRQARRWARPAARLVSALLQLGILLALAWFVLVAVAQFMPDWQGAAESMRELGVPAPGTPVSALLAIAALALLLGLSGRLSVAERPASAARVAIAARAAVERRRLRFLQTVTAERSGAVGRWGFQLSRRAGSQLAEQPMSLPELVDSYRGFVSEVASWLRWERGPHSRFVVGIDEVDRIADPEEAERFLNGIKPIFAVPGITYLVTVSEEAATRFEQRFVHARTAVDSAFDEVVRVDRFTLRESINLLRRRVVGFPDIFIAVAHCMSGGLPRDLVRAARKIVELRVGSRRSELWRILPQVLARELAELRTAALTRASPRRTGPVASLLADPAWPALPAEGGWWWDERSPLATAAETLVQATAADHALAEEYDGLAAAIYFYATVHDLFWSLTRPAVPRPRSSGTVGPTASVATIERLAEIRGLLAAGGDLAGRRLDELRSTAGLPLLAPPPSTKAGERRPRARPPHSSR